jgi:ketosteroid isomerase-like protein
VEAKFAAVNRHAISEIAALYAPDAVVTASDFCKPRAGRAEVERTYAGIFGFLPDAIADVQEYVVEGDRVAVRYVVRGHVQGREVAIRILNFFTVRDGLIVRDDGVFDNGGRACTP